MKLADRVDFAVQRLLVIPSVAVSASLPVLVIALAFATHHPALLRYLMPSLLPVCAVMLWARSRSAYFGFVLTVWFFIPLLRRLVDYSAGPLDPNPMLLAPYLTTLAVPLLRAPLFVKAPIARIFPFLLCFVGIFVGLAAGFFRYPFTSVIHDLLNWMTPVAFAALLTLEDPAEFSASIQTWFPMLVVVSAIYTLAQFAFVFPWDIAWLVNLDAPSQGGTDAFALRAFGPLNSAGTAAFVLSTGSLFILNHQRWWRVPALSLTILALLTTQVRAGWVVLAVGLLISLCKRPKPTGMAICFLFCLGLSLSVAGIASRNATISERLASFRDPSNDDSANGRMEGYSAAWNDLESHPFGHGLGVPEDYYDVPGSFSLLDAAPVHILTTFGWLGGAAYCMGFLLILFPTLGGIALSKDNDFLITAVPAVSLTGIFLLGSITVALSGFLIFSFLPASAAFLKDPVVGSSPSRLLKNSP